MRFPDVLHGMRAGARAYLVYGIVETAFLSVLPWMLTPEYLYKALDWPTTIAVFISYVLCGTLVGGVTALVLPIDITGSFALLASALVSSAAQLRAHSTLLTPLMHLVAVAVLTTLLVASHRLPRPGLLRILWNPWVVALLMIAPGWAGLRMPSGFEHPTAFRVSASLAAGLAICIAARLLMTGARWTLPRPNGPAWPTFARLGAAAVGLCALSAILGPRVLYDVADRSAPAGRLPNVILVSLDTVRADHLSVYGYARNTTPELVELADEATVFTHALSTADYTLPSHASMFTSLYPTEHGAHSRGRNNIDQPLDAARHTLAEILKGIGYWTMGVSANYGFVSHDYGLDRGFAAFDQRPPSIVFGDLPSFYLRQALHLAAARLTERAYLQRMYRPAEEVNQAVISLVDGRPSEGRPFFLFVNYMDAHNPYFPPPPYDRQFLSGPIPSAASSWIKGMRDGRAATTPEQRAYLISQYDGAIAYIDAQLGKLFDWLEQQGIYDDSLIIVTADHGEAFGEKGFIGHGVSLHEDQIHVPLIVKFPGLKQRTIVQNTVSGVDLLPTILDLFGLQPLAGASGRSLRAVDERSNDGRGVIAEHFPLRGELPELTREAERIDRALTMGGVKLIVPANGDRRLFNVMADPGEAQNLYPTHREIAARLELFLRDWVAKAEDATRRRPELGKDQRDLLRSLGYVR